MRFRTRLLLIFALTITGAVALVTGAVSVLARRAFEESDSARRQGLIDQFQKRLAEQGAEVVHRLERVAASRELLRIAVETAQPLPDLAQFVNDAEAQAAATSLDYLDILRADGTIISSAHWPAKFNYKNDWSVAVEDRLVPEAFLSTIPTPEGSVLALIAIRQVKAGDRVIEVIGGKRLDADFLASLGLAPDMRAAFVDPKGIDPKGKVDARLQPLVARVSQTLQSSSETIGTDAVLAMPLERRKTLMGLLTVSTSLGPELALESRILRIGLLASFAGIVLGVLMGWWATERVTRPVMQLAEGARAVAAGHWESRVDVSSPDEIGELAAAFNVMTQQLIEQRERAIQAERVAAWRELARRLAHELKNPLFPLQITVENLRRARELSAAEFEEVFQESTQMLLAELGKLKTIIGRFSDFAKMPPPELEQVEVNELIRDSMKLFDAGAKKIEVVMDLYPGSLSIHADPEQLGRALRNLALNAMDAMPDGGRLTLRTRPAESGVRIEVSDSGAGLTEEECSRLFTPYYTTKQHGTGLGLAIVQSVVSDHHGRIWVESQPGSGATFIMDLPA